MKVLIACEESQRVCIAFRKRGHEAYSCDIQEPSGGHPELHILGDALRAIEGGKVTTINPEQTSRDGILKLCTCRKKKEVVLGRRHFQALRRQWPNNGDE